MAIRGHLIQPHYFGHNLDNRMSIEHIVKAAEEFDKSVNLSQLNQDERDLLSLHGKHHKLLPHNPPAWVASEKTWDKAKKLVKRRWKKYSEPWSTVADLYFKLGGKKKKIKKKAQLEQNLADNEELVLTLTAIYSIAATLTQSWSIEKLGDLLNKAKMLKADNPKDMKEAEILKQQIKPLVDYMLSYTHMMQ